MMSTYKLLVLMLLSLAYCVISCSESPVQVTLNHAEAIMETHPDSAMSLLSTINKNELSGKRQKAQYALLMSMALDKNYIDTTTFDVLQPAIDYYLDKGTPDEKIRTYYYQGVIYRNRADRDNALNSYSKAIDAGKDCPNSLVLARAYVGQGKMFNELYAFKDYTDSYLMASQIYKANNNDDLRFDCLLNAYNGAILMNNKVLSDSLSIVCNNIKSHDPTLLKYLLSNNISYAARFGDKKMLEELVDRQMDIALKDEQLLMQLAFAYNKLGRNDLALDLLNSVDRQSETHDELRFLSYQELIFEDLGMYKDALGAYKRFVAIQDSIDMQKFDYMFNSEEKRSKIELQALKDKERNTRVIWSFIAGIVGLVLLVIILLLLVRSNKVKKELVIQNIKAKEAENAQLKSEGERLALEKGQLELENTNLQLQRDNMALEAEILTHRVVILESESENLKRIMESQEELPQEVQKTIKVRIEMLNSLLAGYITANKQYEKPYDDWIKELTANTEVFMDSNRLAFQASHPRFIQYFEDLGLTVDEINYVCLYAIGLKGKEVGNYMKKKSHVNTSSSIRKKLGIDKHETNIGIYVRKLLKKL